MHRLVQIAALFCSLLARALGDPAAEVTYLDYLTTHDLPAEECAAHSPSELFKIILNREKLAYRGTPGQEATVVDTFYQKYLETLKPYNDARHANSAQARQPLRDLFYCVTEAFAGVAGDRSYITHPRIDAFVEHLITSLDAPGPPYPAYLLDFSVDDCTAYLRARLIIIHDTAMPTPDFDAFRARIATKLRQIPEKHSVMPLALHYCLTIFADNYRTPLDPLRAAPEAP